MTQRCSEARCGSRKYSGGAWRMSFKNIDTFLFVSFGEIDYLGIFSRILSTTAKTAIRLRIAVTISTLNRYPQNLSPCSYIDVNVFFDVFNAARHNDSTTTFDTATQHFPLSSATKTAMGTSLLEKAFIIGPKVVLGVLRHSAARLILFFSIFHLRDPSDRSKEMILFARTLQSESA